MTDLDTLMQGPRLKVKRANGHIDELRRRTAPLDPTLYSLEVRKVHPSVIHRNATTFELAYRPKEPIPQTLGLIIGDAVHNLRAALDHFANGVVCTFHSSPPDDRISFPMSSKWENFVSSRHFAPIEESIPGAKELILKEIRPDKGPNERLWAFNALDNDDKHNLILPTVTFADVSNINAVLPGNNRLINCGAGGNAAGPMVIIRSGGPITVENNLHASVDVKFGNGTLFKDDPVIPTLSQIADVVTDALNILERHVIATKFS